MSELDTGIYRIHNLIDDKSYIGKSEVSIRKRWLQHKRGEQSNKHLQNAIEKYGIDNFEFVVLEHCEPDKCCERERYWIEHFKANNPEFGYNSTNGGENHAGFKMNPEAIQKSLETRKRNFELGITKKKHSEETKQRMRDAWVRRKANGYKMSDETKRKLSVAHKGKKPNISEEARERRIHRGPDNYWYGKHLSEEQKKNLSEKAKGRKHTEEAKRKMSEKRRGELNAMYGKRGELSPHYGTKAMHTKDGENFYVTPDQVDEYLAKGCMLGKTSNVRDNIRDSRFKWYYIYNGEKYKGQNDMMQYLRSSGYPTISSTAIEKICKGCQVKGYDNLYKKIVKTRREDLED